MCKVSHHVSFSFREFRDLHQSLMEETINSSHSTFFQVHELVSDSEVSVEEEMKWWWLWWESFASLSHFLPTFFVYREQVDDDSCVVQIP